MRSRIAWRPHRIGLPIAIRITRPYHPDPYTSPVPSRAYCFVQFARCPIPLARRSMLFRKVQSPFRDVPFCLITVVCCTVHLSAVLYRWLSNTTCVLFLNFFTNRLNTIWESDIDFISSDEKMLRD